MKPVDSMVLKLRIKKEIDMRMSFKYAKEKPKAKLPINEDTCYDIFYDVYECEKTQYLYIKMTENTANAPFFYNRSYELKELYDNHRIFKTCETMEEVRDNLESLFKNNKIKLRYNEKDNDEIIIMEMDVILFAKPYKVVFELYREMVVENEKNDKLIELYKLNKKRLKQLKEIKEFIEKNKQKENVKTLIKLFKDFNIPGTE